MQIKSDKFEDRMGVAIVFAILLGLVIYTISRKPEASPYFCETKYVQENGEEMCVDYQREKQLESDDQPEVLRR